jgi:hypothetical protein
MSICQRRESPLLKVSIETVHTHDDPALQYTYGSEVSDVCAPASARCECGWKDALPCYHQEPCKVSVTHAHANDANEAER